MFKTVTRLLGLVLLAGLVSAGCTLKQYAEQADNAAYRTLEGGQKQVTGEIQPFTIGYSPLERPEGRPDCIKVGEHIIPLRQNQPPAVLSLTESVAIAFRNSRADQDRKEELYLNSLALANARRDWNWTLWGGSTEGDVTRTSVGGVSTDDSGVSSSGASWARRFVNGGLLAVAATLDASTNFLGSSNNIATSLISANFTQPLLQGAWNGIAYESQYRLERDFLFAIYDFDRYRQEFAADIVTRYYGVVRQKDQLENERANIERLRQTVALTRTTVEAGAAPRFELDQAEQDFLQAQVRLQRDEQAYRNALDVFKISLGLPVQCHLELLYPDPLRDLLEAGPTDMRLDQSQAVTLALASRPDVLVQRATLRDAERNIELAADEFLPQVDLVLGYDASGTEPQDFWRTRFNASTRQAGIQFNYDFDQTDNRDAYRATMIARDRAQRDLEQFLDNVRLDVRQSYRELEQSRQTYELQLKNVALARRRRTLTRLEQQAGRAAARDVLEADEALRNAQNGLTQALVAYTTTRLEFLAQLGLIDIDERGVLNERAEPITFQRLAERYPYVGAE